MSLNIKKARVTVTLEMDYIDSSYIDRNHKHKEKFFREVKLLEERYNALVNDPENPNYSIIPKSVLKCEYLIDGEWQKSN
jgi:hypothetical protein